MTNTHHQRQVNRIIAMFCKAIKPEERHPFDTKSLLAMPHLTDPKLEVIRHYAQRYGVDQRTAYRWQRSGVDLTDAAAVAMYISNLKHPHPRALEAVSKILKSELNTK